MNIQHINEDYSPVVTSQRDGTCHFTFCGRPGVVLVIDVIAPGWRYWMCAECWATFCAVPCFLVVKDRRERQGEP